MLAIAHLASVDILHSSVAVLPKTTLIVEFFYCFIRMSREEGRFAHLVQLISKI